MIDLLAELRAFLPEGALLTAPEDKAPFETDWRKIHNHPALCVALPERTDEVAKILMACHRAHVSVVPQGGNTGLVAGAVPVPGREQIVLSLKRMRHIREFDETGSTITVESGLTLQEVQQAAAARNRLFPVSFASEGSAEIGGVISTNAGGLQVLSYGSTRAQVLGLEVVLADGRVWNGLKRLRKDNTGFDLKQLFIGAEGLLGIITAATLQLRRTVTARATALVGIPSLEDALLLFRLLRDAGGEAMTMCEFISAAAMELALAHLTNSRRPFAAPAYVLTEFSAQDEITDIEAILEHALSAAMDASCMTEAVIARNLRERDALIALRDVISDAELAEGGAVKHDISVPISEIPAAIRAVEGLIERRFPDCRLNVFGHIGDGNLHVNLRPPAGQTLSDLVPRSAEITRAVEEIAVALGGSFSAEHGIGQMRLTGMANHKSAVELDLMRAIKHALDPDQLLNPGKMLP